MLSPIFKSGNTSLDESIISLAISMATSVDITVARIRGCHYPLLYIRLHLWLYLLLYLWLMAVGTTGAVGA